MIGWTPRTAHQPDSVRARSDRALTSVDSSIRDRLDNEPCHLPATGSIGWRAELPRIPEWFKSPETRSSAGQSLPQGDSIVPRRAGTGLKGCAAQLRRDPGEVVGESYALRVPERRRSPDDHGTHRLLGNPRGATRRRWCRCTGSRRYGASTVSDLLTGWCRPTGQPPFGRGTPVRAVI